jgi:hypothetical protein
VVTCWHSLASRRTPAGTGRLIVPDPRAEGTPVGASFRRKGRMT